MTKVTDNALHDLQGGIEKIAVHDHLCLIYETQEEQFSAVIPFIKIGLARGEKCVYIVDDNTAGSVIGGLQAAGVDVEARNQAGQLVIASKQEAYLKEGYFDPDWMIDFLKRATEQAKNEGYSALRVTGEMTWVLGGDPGSERLMEYEAKLNYFFPHHDALAICQYNRKRFSPEIIKDVIATHPLVICGGLVCKNFYYVPPDDFLGDRQPEKEIDRLLANIVNRAKVEESLHLSEERMRLFFERQLVGMAISSAEKHWLQVNDKLCEMLGYTRQELAELTWAELTYPEDLPADLVQFEHLLQGAIDGYLLEKRFVRKDGGLVFTNLAVACVRKADRSVDYVLAILEDVSERKRAEANIRELNQQLRLALNSAEAASKAKSLFLANMSHQLRTPLNAILGFSNMLRRDPSLNPKQRDNLDIVNRSGEQLLTLIDDVLEMVNIDAGRLQLAIAPFELCAMLREICDEMRVRAEEKGLQLRYEKTSGCPRFFNSDAARLRRIVLQLIDNALKFTVQGFVAVRLRIAPSSPQRLSIEVEDSGPGIAPENQQDLFEPFVQLGEAGTLIGTGLGLAASRQLARLMGGDLSVESKPGQGALFRLELPLAVADITEPAKAKRAEWGKPLGIEDNAPRRILIAEHDPEQRLQLFRLMTDIGLETKMADNGERCLDAVRRWHPHLILLAQNLPILDGLSTSKRLRQLTEAQSLKIVGLAATNSKEDAEKLLAAGMDAWLPPAYGPDEVYACLAKQLALVYRYSTPTTRKESKTVALTPAMLAKLPESLRSALAEALERLDSEHITKLIEQIAERDAVLAQTLSHCAERFDYPAISAALKATA